MFLFRIYLVVILTLESHVYLNSILSILWDGEFLLLVEFSLIKSTNLEQFVSAHVNNVTVICEMNPIVYRRRHTQVRLGVQVQPPR